MHFFVLSKPHITINEYKEDNIDNWIVLRRLNELKKISRGIINMPNFKIRRRRKVVEQTPPPAPPQEEKHDEMEESYSDPSEETAIDDAMRDLKVAPAPKRENRPQYVQRRPQVAPRQEYYQPQYQNPTNVVRQNPNPASYQYPKPTRPHIPDQYQRNPTMQIANPRSKTKRGGAKLL